jgi:hypothetical protein
VFYTRTSTTWRFIAYQSGLCVFGRLAIGRPRSYMAMDMWDYCLTQQGGEIERLDSQNALEL